MEYMSLLENSGTGKSITLTYMLMRYQKMYPKLMIKTNYYYEFENAHIGHWKDVVNRK